MNKISTASIIIILALGATGSLAIYRLDAKNRQDFNGKIALLQRQISGLRDEVSILASGTIVSALPQREIVQRETIRGKSQDQLLTEAVAGSAPAVVSIVISKDVPLLEVAYVNPFGDDPFFKDFGFQVPVYQQKGTQKQKVGAGTGFLISRNGYIATNRHVVEDTQAEYTALLADGQQKAATVVYRDPIMDLAIVKIDGSDYHTVTLGDSDGLQLGQTVIAIGNALGEYNNSVSTGIVSGLHRTIQAQDQSGKVENLEGVIQTDAAINPGNSGGPLLTLEGKVIGVNVATVAGSNSISFSIPISLVRNIIRNVTGQ